MSTSSAPALAVEGLRVAYPDGTLALDGLEATLERGGALVVIGESGSGKSTLLAAILGLLPKRATVTGSVRVDGVEQVGASRRSAREVRRRRVGYVPQDPYAAIDPLRSVVHHVRFAALSLGIQRVHEAKQMRGLFP